jgi:GT2 family glycosyltransferase
MDKPREAFGPSVRHTDFLTGCALFTTREIFEDAGGFDERLFLYCEDVDLSLRMRSAGSTLLVTGAAAVLHKVSASVHKEDAAGVNFMLTSSTLYCCLKHFPFWGKCVVALKILRKIAGFSLKLLDRKNYPFMRSYLKGVAYGFRLHGQIPLK